MGLFGGFRAKFTKDSTAKSASKTSKKNTVVCVGYRVYSEFQDPPQYLQGPAIRKEASAIKTVLSPPESSRNVENNPAVATTSAPIKTQIRTNPNVNKPPKRQAPEITHKSTETTSNTIQALTNSKTNISKSAENISAIELRNGKPNGGLASNSVYEVGKTSSFNPVSNISNNNQKDPLDKQNKVAPKSILKSKSLMEISDSKNHISDTISTNTVIPKNGYNTDSEDDDDDRTLTLSSKKTKEHDGYKLETVDYLSANKSTSRGHTTQVSTYVHTEVSSTSEKHTDSNSTYSSGYGYAQNQSRIGTTSSYAANIFFGGDEEPIVQRPRRVNLSDAQTEEDESRSSVEC